MSSITIAQFDGLIRPVAGAILTVSQVSGVVDARSMDDIIRAAPGSLIVIDPSFEPTTNSYRFDLILRTLPDATPAVLTYHASWSEPSITARRIAEERGIALGHLLPTTDVVALALHLQSLAGSDGQAGIGALELVGRDVERAVDVHGIPELLSSCSAHLGSTLVLTDAPTSVHALPLRTRSAARFHIDIGDELPRAVTRSALAQIARHIEDLFEADYEARELPDVTRSELFNEILLSDSATGADAVNRLRNSDFPIDGSHLAIRVDCHEPLPAPSTIGAVTRCQARTAEILLTEMRQGVGQWTQAGTSNSVLLISTLERAHSEMTGAETERVLERAVAEAEAVFPGLHIHVGVGTPHLGAAGFRASVAEAATAVRTARARGRANQVEQFDRLGLGRALVRWAEIDGVRPVIDEIMRPLLRQSPRQARDAITTLRAYLDAGRNITKTAELLHLHRNTVHYRIDRITAALDVDIDDPDDRLLLELSCRVVEAEVL